MVEQQRYTRLQHLLQKSSIYSKFLLQRMEQQMKEKNVHEERQGRRKKVFKEEVSTLRTFYLSITPLPP